MTNAASLVLHGLVLNDGAIFNGWSKGLQLVTRLAKKETSEAKRYGDVTMLYKQAALPLPTS